MRRMNEVMSLELESQYKVSDNDYEPCLCLCLLEAFWFG
jgi:hypothetical protein